MKKITIALLAILYVIPSFSQTMEWHIKDNYVDVKYMGNNLFKVKNSSGKWGVINEYGETTVAIQYDSITPIVENRALLLDNTGQFLRGIINEKGQILNTPLNTQMSDNKIFVNFPSFNEGMLAYGVEAGNYYLFGYLDSNGNTRIDPKYYWAAPFNDGKAVIQYKSKNFGLINKSGGTELNDNRKFKFMSTPVDNKLLIAVGSHRGDEISLVTLGANGKLNEVEKLEKETGYSVNITDYKTISYQNGHKYYFDNAMRLISSSTGKSFNEPLTYATSLSISPNFKKMREEGGWKVLHSGKTLFQSSFRDISFCGEEYAIVASQRNTMGVLKLNNNGNISIQNVPAQAEFYHNATVKGNIAVNISGLFSSSQVQIGVIGLKENNQEEKFNTPAGYNGIYNQEVSYFIPATSFDSEVNIPIKINLYIDGMLCKTETKTLTGVHKRAFRVSDANAPEFSDPDGNATITFNVQSLESEPSSSAKVIVSGASNQTKHFNGGDLLYFKESVTIPVESSKTFSFTVTIKEEDCPSYTRTISSTIKHYDLQ